MDTRHADAGRFARLEAPERIAELKPARLLTEIAGVAEGMICVDLGCGTGVFARPMADLAGTTGTVYAVDRQADMLAHIASKGPPANLQLLQTDVGKTGLPGGIADVCLLAFVLHELKAPEDVLSECHRLLKPHGRLTIVEWRMESDKGPPLDIRIDRPRAEELLRRASMEPGGFFEWSARHYVITALRP